MPPPTAVVDALAAGVRLAPDRSPYEVDWTGRVRGRALAVALPDDAGQVAAVLTTCAQHGVGVTVRGGGTGLVAGAVPDGTVVLCTSRLTGLGPVEDGSVLAGAGVTLASLQAHARAAGWDYGVDMASRDSATVGGTVATNAGGLHVVAHGTTRAQVLGAQAVLADGSVVDRTAGLRKDATGYDLAQLLVSSEGTLGVVTAVRLRLVAPARGRETALVGLPDVASAVELVGRARRAAQGLRAAELLLDDGLALVRDELGLPAPLRRPAPVLLLLEAEAGLAGALDGGPVLDVAVAADAADAARLWACREGLTEALARLGTRLGTPHKLDVSLPVGRIPAFLAELPAAVSRAAAGCTTHVFGHVGDGNLHVNVLGPGPDDDAVDDAVLRLASAHGGSIGAEHGVGRLKRRWLHLSRTPAELAAMRAVKAALDPAGLLGRGVLLPDPPGAADSTR
ncbi:MAG TPA: FAD-binding oxidoreductase [Mycobacteriales bacterium]|nr:FAD-binding oxidoreductase [Mycobacteriales bacterium]